MTPIIIGCSWDSKIIVDPAPGETVDDVIANMTGSTIVGRLFNGGALVANFGVSYDAPSRLVILSLDPTATGALTAQQGCRIDLRITTSSNKVIPVKVTDQIRIATYTFEA